MGLRRRDTSVPGRANCQNARRGSDLKRAEWRSPSVRPGCCVREGTAMREGSHLNRGTVLVQVRIGWGNGARIQRGSPRFFGWMREPRKRLRLQIQMRQTRVSVPPRVLIDWRYYSDCYLPTSLSRVRLRPARGVAGNTRGKRPDVLVWAGRGQ
jgi:hypothetical protein